MKKLLNTLYVTTQGAYLAAENDTVAVRQEKETKLRVPVHNLGGIVCFGRVSASPPLMALCAEHQVALSFHTEHGKFLARVQGPVAGNVLLRREQYRRADSDRVSAKIARAMVCAKIANCRLVMLRAARELDESSSDSSEVLRSAAVRMARLVERTTEDLSVDEVRGKEGEAAAIYFSAFSHLISPRAEGFAFNGRSRRPPLDPVNALLSFHYTLLCHDAIAALEANGLDPYVGFLHRDRPGRPSLALDLMEEFRPFLADRASLSLINRRQLELCDFETSESGAVVMNSKARKELLVNYQARKQEEIMHPFLGEKVAVGLLPHVQALLLARYLRGDLTGYPPFIWK